MFDVRCSLLVACRLSLVVGRWLLVVVYNCSLVVRWSFVFFVVCGLSFVGCLWCVVRCSSLDVCCFLFGVKICCLSLCVVCCFLFVVLFVLRCVVCWLIVVCCLLFVGCCVLSLLLFVWRLCVCLTSSFCYCSLFFDAC